MNLITCPPYDVIGPDMQRTLLARHPLNAVRLDLPEIQPGEEPDDRYRRAARMLAGWRVDGTLRQRNPAPASTSTSRSTRSRAAGESAPSEASSPARLEDLTAGSGVLPHERTLSARRKIATSC